MTWRPEYSDWQPGDDSVLDAIDSERPRLRIRYGTGGPRLSGVDVWMDWISHSLTFLGQAQAILDVMQYRGGKSLMCAPAFQRWAARHVDRFNHPSPELVELLRRNRERRAG